MSKAEAGYRSRRKKKFVTNIFYFTHILKSISVCVIKTCCLCEVCAKTVASQWPQCSLVSRKPLTFIGAKSTVVTNFQAF